MCADVGECRSRGAGTSFNGGQKAHPSMSLTASGDIDIDIDILTDKDAD